MTWKVVKPSFKSMVLDRRPEAKLIYQGGKGYIICDFRGPKGEWVEVTMLCNTARSAWKEYWRSLPSLPA